MSWNDLPEVGDQVKAARADAYISKLTPMDEGPDHNHVEPTPMCIGHQPAEFGPSFCGSADSDINIFPSKRPASPIAAFAEIAKLHLRRLHIVRAADTRV